MSRQLVLAKRAALAVALLLVVGVALGLAALFTPAWLAADGVSTDVVAPGQRFVRVVVGEVDTCVTLESVATGKQRKTCYATFPTGRGKSSITSVTTNATVTPDGVCSEDDLAAVAGHLGIPERLRIASVWRHQCGGVHWVTVFAQVFSVVAAAFVVLEMLYFSHRGVALVLSDDELHPWLRAAAPGVSVPLMAVVLVLWGVVTKEPGFRLSQSFSMAVVATVSYVVGSVGILARSVFLRRFVAAPIPTTAPVLPIHVQQP
ncbi:hypothetical protein PINS_up023110 [Pythium insidiosum]|nr:hypothetical protein PINS_up012474 [Pythium insidiosum]GLE10853.1 hypothetical protein PINS_up023110 [Pythium insidiosum]